MKTAKLTVQSRDDKVEVKAESDHGTSTVLLDIETAFQFAKELWIEASVSERMKDASAS